MAETKQGLVNVEVSVGGLYPVIPRHSGRYDVKKKVRRSHSVVEPGMFATSRSPVPRYLPPQWSAFVHPEGKVYFERSGPFRVITDSYLYNPEVAEKVMSWVHHVEKLVEEKSFPISDSVELYLQPENEDCNYYFADHATRTIFWLDQYETTELGLLPAVSPSHLRLQLEEQYWIHLEFFCMHTINLSNITEEMIGLLIHACGDHMTSNSSTFPYNLKECRGFLDILTPARDRCDHHVIATVARLFGVITFNRYWTHYGQEQPRLSRDISIQEDDDHEIDWSNQLISALSLTTSEFFRSRLNSIFVDSYVYVADWQKLVSDSTRRWKNAAQLSLCFLVLHIFYFYLPVSPLVAGASGVLFTLSLLSSAFLIHRHQDLEDVTADIAHSYLSSYHSKSYKFQKLAFILSLPQTFSLWGLVAFIGSWLSVAWPETGYLFIFFIICGTVLKAMSRLASLPQHSDTPSSQPIKAESCENMV